MTQTWNDLLFAHWPIPIPVIRPLIPSELELHTFDRQCWIAVTPFHMSGIEARGLPPPPGLSRFPELNVRTYVSYGDKAGVYFFSLDAANRIAVSAARLFFRLPYFWAKMCVAIRGQEIDYNSCRYERSAEFRARYKPISEVQLQPKGTLAHWLTERYCLYAVSSGKVYRAEIHHAPWPLQDAEAEIAVNTMADAAGIALPHTSPFLHFARRLEVLIWPLRRLS
jgi:uncharacterized protein YqjF (DUF2071 family)